MRENYFEQNSNTERESALSILNLSGNPKPTEILDAYIVIFNAYKDKIVDDNLPNEIVRAKNALSILEADYDTSTASFIDRTRIRKENETMTAMRKSTTEVQNQMKNGVKDLWKMFGK